MAFEATFVQEGVAIDFTPTVAVLAGDVVANGDLLGVANQPIAANEQGALHVGGVAKFAKQTGVVLALGDKVYWNDVTNLANATSGIRALGVLTFPVIAATTETVTIDTRVYTYKTTPAVADEVAVGADVAASRANLVAAINNGVGGGTPNALVTAAVSGGTVVITAINYGTAANGKATTETLAGASNAWGATTLGSGTGGHTAGAGGALIGKCVKVTVSGDTEVQVKLD